MFALLEIARIYKALNCFADLQGPISYNDARNNATSRKSVKEVESDADGEDNTERHETSIHNRKNFGRISFFFFH